MLKLIAKWECIVIITIDKYIMMRIMKVLDWSNKIKLFFEISYYYQNNFYVILSDGNKIYQND